jgi:hypothetical protein
MDDTYILIKNFDEHYLHVDLIEHLENSPSFLGWLLMLSEDEFKMLHKEFEKSIGSASDFILVFGLILMNGEFPEKGTEVIMSDLKQELCDALTGIRMIALHKLGFGKLTIKDVDDDWILYNTDNDYEYISSYVTNKKANEIN